MKIAFVALVASSFLLVQVFGSAIPSEHLPRKPRDVGRQYSWRVQNQDQDHITYVRTPAAGSESSSSVSGSSSSGSSSSSSSGSQSQSGLFATRSASLATRSGPSSGSQLTILIPETDCNKTTTPAPPTQVRGSRKPWQATGLSTKDSSYSNSESVVERRAQPELRSRSTINSGTGRVVSTGSTGTRSQSQTTGAHPHEGNYFWMVSHRTDDHITYTRRSNGSESRGTDGGLQQGQLRQLGTGSNTVSARVVDSKNDADISTEEGLLTRGGSKTSRNNNNLNVNQKSHGSHLTHDLVHPYATRNATSSSSRTSSRTTVTTRSGAESTRHASRVSSSQSQSGGALKSNPATGRVNIIFQKQQQQTANAGDLTKTADESDSSYPNVGDEVDGWRVVSKNKEHISWERVTPTLTVTGGAHPASAGHLVRSLDSSRHHQGSNSISEQSSSSRSSSRQWQSGRAGAGGRSGTGRLGGQRSQSSKTAEISDGFPVVFETYSKATFENDGVNQVGTIRTTLSNTTNWNVGDELSGWKVISKDGQSITWFKVNSDDEDSQSGGRQLKSGGSLGFDDDDLNEEDLLAGAGRGGAGGAGGADGDSDAYKGPPGTWYLAKESKNSITWQRDNVPDDVVFDMNEYPRIGDTQSQWQVSSKSKNHISWKRIGSTSGSEEDVIA